MRRVIINNQMQRLIRRRLLIDLFTEDHRLLWQRPIKPHHIVQLLFKIRVITDFIVHRQVRL